MKKIYTSLRGLLTAIIALTTLATTAQETINWDFTKMPDSDLANLKADTGNWEFTANGGSGGSDRYANKNAMNNATVIANGSELEMTKGLTFNIKKAKNLRIDINNAIRLNGKDLTITLPRLAAGAKVTVVTMTANTTDARGITADNLTVIEGFTTSTEQLTNVGTVTNEGPVTLKTTGGLAFYSITVEGNNAGGGDNPTPTPGNDHSVSMNTLNNQMLLRMVSGDVKYYNTAELSDVNIDKATGTVSVLPKVGDWNDKFKQNVAAINFTKAPETGENGEIVNSGVNITEAKGWLESAYMKWELLDGATSYRVYIKGGKYGDYTKIDRELVRNYGSYGRADMVGLPAGVYSMKVVPVIGGTEDQSKASEAKEMAVKAYDRSGFANFNYANGVGAYTANGDLKPNARVIYVTAQTAKTVTCDVITDNKGKTTTYTGFQAILDGYMKGYDSTPIAFRLIGTIKDSDMDGFSSSAEGIQIKNNKSGALNITIEGIGDDATTWGYGFLLRNAESVELRNFANMLCMDDCISLDTDNKHCWVHHIDLFYGKTGGDSDQAKGDGTVDVKGDSQYITIAYNRFHDSGKSSLCGMKSESGPNYIDYHHNWFDHSDSRHPRIRTMTVHVWNNYYDGCAKYGVGATTSSSVFVENNFFRHTLAPMMSSKQGTDANGDGTFSGENGGIIKSFGNIYAEKGSANKYNVITHKANPSSFDCYEASSRDEKVPATYKALSGGSTYNNFDTDPALMYSYTPLDATEVPAAVTGFYGAGRLNHGDFTWDLNYPNADTDYSVISALKTALQNYKSSLVGIFE